MKLAIDSSWFSCYQPDCESKDVRIVTRFEGDDVIPDDKYGDNNTGIVVRCNKCDDVTGYLIIPTGVCVDDMKEGSA